MYTSASTVGLPRLSKIWRATTLVMALGEALRRYSACGRGAHGERHGVPAQRSPMSRVRMSAALTMKLFGSGAFALTVALITSSTVLLMPWRSMYS